MSSRAPRAPLSAVSITRNAAAVLEPSLDSLAFADEVVVVDSSSSDGTVELAAPHQPPSWHLADLMVRHLKHIFHGVAGAEHRRWIGESPTLPDVRPALGRAPRLANVYYGDGHQHVGLKSDTETALATLPEIVRSKFVAADGKPDANFARLYDALLETEPSF